MVGFVAQEVAREDETPIGCAFATLHPEDGDFFPSDYHGTGQSTDEPEHRLVVSEEGEMGRFDGPPLQAHESHVDHPVEALERHHETNRQSRGRGTWEGNQGITLPHQLLTNVEPGIASGAMKNNRKNVRLIPQLHFGATLDARLHCNNAHCI